jgi:Arc/MetJ-type ribon-helix-helix transcriptional regulator
MKKVMLASVAVNKAADYYSKADEVVRAAAPLDLGAIEAADEGTARQRMAKANANPRPRKTTLEQLRDLEAALDGALDRIYQRFCRGEITAKEMDSGRQRLIQAFNRRVSSENIRYRSLLRPVAKPG